MLFVIHVDDNRCRLDFEQFGVRQNLDAVLAQRFQQIDFRRVFQFADDLIEHFNQRDLAIMRRDMRRRLRAANAAADDDGMLRQVELAEQHVGGFMDMRQIDAFDGRNNRLRAGRHNHAIRVDLFDEGAGDFDAEMHRDAAPLEFAFLPDRQRVQRLFARRNRG